MSDGLAGSSSEAAVMSDGLAGSSSEAVVMSEDLFGDSSEAAVTSDDLARSASESAELPRVRRAVYLLVAGAGALLPTWRGIQPTVGPRCGFYGAVQAEWLFRSLPDGEEQTYMWDLACRGTRAVGAFGCVFYVSSSLVALKEPCELEAGTRFEPHQLVERY